MTAAPLTIEYETTDEDTVVFQLHHCLTTPASRRTLQAWRLMSTYVGAAAAFTLGVSASQRLLVGLVALLAVGAVIWAAWPGIWRRWARKAILRVVGGGTERHRMTIEPAGLREQTEKNDSLNMWSGVQRINDTDTHVFVYVGPALAFIIPKRGQAREVEEFVCEIRRRVEVPSTEKGAH
jgi:hypothetical protein